VLHALKTERLMMKANIKALETSTPRPMRPMGPGKTEKSICPLKKR
jgi:hypothetical protein